MEINGNLIKYEDGKIWRFGKYKWTSKQETWYILKGSIHIDQNGYKSHVTQINGKLYVTSRLIYKLYNPNWELNNNSKDNTIDHININSLDNRIENLRIATMSQQNLNKDCVINAKGYCWDRGKWRAYIRINNKLKHLGYFDKEEEARQAYLNAVQEYRIII